MIRKLVPLFRRQPLVAGVDPLRYDFVGQRPHHDADRLFAVVEHTELLEQDRRHDQPFETAERDRFVARALRHQPSDFAEYTRSFSLEQPVIARCGKWSVWGGLET